MKKKILYLMVGLLGMTLSIKAQPDCFFTHYSSEDGLSQNTIMSILQDGKGNMWFSTWDGINKFDGYSFKTYKARLDNHVALSHNRVDYICADKYGFLWLLTYDSRVYRFDPRTETFERVPADGERDSRISFTGIETLPDGSVWLLTEEEGAIRVTTRVGDYGMEMLRYGSQSGMSPAAHVYKVCQDAAGNEWILSDNGLGKLAAGSKAVESFFARGRDAAAQRQAFYCSAEYGGEIYFGSDGGRVWRYEARSGKFRLLFLPTRARVVALNDLGQGELLIATAQDGFFIHSSGTKTTEHVPSSRFPAADIHSVYVDRTSEVWFEQHLPGVILHFNPRTRILKREEVAVEPTSTDRSRPAFHVIEDIYGTVWVHPYGGGFSRFDRESNSLRPFYNSLSGGDWRFSNKIHAAFSDRQGNLWMCTHSKGLEKVTFRPSQFRMITPEAHTYESLSNEVRALCEDRQGNLWVGLKDGKLRMYDCHRMERGYLTEAGTVSHVGLPLRGNVYFVLEDSRRNLWIATKGDGLVKAEPRGGAGRYKLTRYQYRQEDLYSLSDDNVYCVYEDRRGRIWAATFAGGVNYLTRNKAGREVFISARNLLKGYPIDYCYKSRFITGDRQGRIWIGTTVGALMVDGNFEHPGEAEFHHFLRVPDDAHSLSNNDVHWITATQKGELYLATFGGGLNKLVSLDGCGRARFKSYTTRDGLSSDVLLSIREDQRGNLWMSTENGICQFRPSEERCENYDDKAISFRVRFSEAASECTSSGHILLGASTGIFVFHPDSIRKSRYVPPMVFCQLLVANQEVVPGKGEVLQQGLDDTRELELSHRENIFTIQYAALDYSAPLEIQYAYMLEGLEKGWNYVGRQRTATYTNLPKGHYVFKVRSTNGEGVWTENTRRLEIEVLPSFWETPLAYFLYVLGIVLVIVVAVYVLFTIYRLKHEVTVEQRVTDLKLRFFTDVSHELRTPLTLIAGPVECVLRDASLSAEARGQLQVVERNTNRMLRLINQILDFRKIQNHKMRMQVQRIDVVAFIRRIRRNFEAMAEERRIDFLLETEREELYVWVDVDKFEKIVFNLLSNAFKYTADDKMIKVFIREDEHSVSVGVQDQGIGIAETDRKSLFVRFENLVDRNLFNQSSTGIGLSLVKELVEMHRAVIAVDSRLGAGSCFVVKFQKGKEHYGAAVEFLQDDCTAGGERMEETSAGLPVLLPVTDAGEERNGEAELGTLLLVEDHAELRQFLRSIFASDFRVVEAADGQQGLEKALQLIPDLIISDVMMPRMDGIALTRELRADSSTSHIPLVLLTAKTSIESQLEGLEYGADDYITKPFSATCLQARVRNLLAQRRKWQEGYRARLMADELHAPSGGAEDAGRTEPEMSAIDRKFMSRLKELMEANLDNGELVVDDLVRELAVSRSVFFKKLKTLTGLAPVEFIKEMRIQRAVQLIDTGEFSMTQISYMVGINDPRYFSKCFRQKMGMTPTEYREGKR